MIKTLAISAVVLAVAIVGGILHFTDADPVVTFVVCGIALGGVAWTIGIATESVGARFGPAVTGALQSTLGNLPELFIVLFALSAGELVVAQFSILGSLFANALLVLGLTVAAALVSDWFVHALDPAVEAIGISKAFTGLVSVAIAGNAVENVVAVQLAWKGQNDLAISVVKNSVAQIACFLWPVLVILSLFFAERLTFVVEPVYLGALALTAIALWQVTGDGEAVLFEGLALVSLYVVLATLVWFE